MLAIEGGSLYVSLNGQHVLHRNGEEELSIAGHGASKDGIKAEQPVFHNLRTILECKDVVVCGVGGGYSHGFSEVDYVCQFTWSLFLIRL